MPEVKLQVEVLNCTPKPLETMYVSTRNCVTDELPTDLMAKVGTVSETKMQNLLLKCLHAKHYTPFEMVSFVFAVNNMSRVVLAELTRHRTFKFLVKNQRYMVDNSNFGYVRPPEINKNQMFDVDLTAITGDRFALGYNDMMHIINQFYNAMLEAGISQQLARYVLPNATATNAVFAVDFRNLMHFCNLRLCPNVQPEMYQLALQIKKAVTEHNAFLGGLLGPMCTVDGFCVNMQPCGRFPVKPMIESKS